jgi:hypothetical protein
MSDVRTLGSLADRWGLYSTLHGIKSSKSLVLLLLRALTYSNFIDSRSISSTKEISPVSVFKLNSIFESDFYPVVTDLYKISIEKAERSKQFVF